MALAAKLLVGALVLGAGSTATYVAVTGGFGVGGNGTESEASGETQVAASPVAGSSSPRAEPTEGQGQQGVSGGNTGSQVPDSAGGQGQTSNPVVDSSRNVVADTNDQVPDTDTSGGVQSQSDVTPNEGAQRAAESGGASGVSVPGQGATTDRPQTPDGDSLQPLAAGSTENGKSQDIDSDLGAGGVDSAVGAGTREAAEKSSKPEDTSSDERNNPGDGQKTGSQAANAQTQPAGLGEQNGDAAGRGVTPPATPGTTQEGNSPSGGGVSQGVTASAGTVIAQEPAVSSETNTDSSN